MTIFNTDFLRKRFEILREFENPDYEPCFDSYRFHLENLISIVKSTGEELEGNVFFTHGCQSLTPNDLFAGYRKKRQNLSFFALSKSRMVEVGFNAGFSSLLMLESNPNLKIVSIDACYHRYVKPCYDYIKKIYGERILLLQGDSREILPMYLSSDPNFDGYHIDGSHSESIAETDLVNVIHYGKKGSVICMDDTDMPQIRNMITLYLLDGCISHIHDPKYHLTSDSQMFLRIDKTQ
jgi:hypothetical protein